MANRLRKLVLFTSFFFYQRQISNNDQRAWRCFSSGHHGSRVQKRLSEKHPIRKQLGKSKMSTMSISNTYINDVLMSCLMAVFFQRDTVISFGNQSVQSFPTSETPLLANRDYILEVIGDQVIEKPSPCYNLCQV